MPNQPIPYAGDKGAVGNGSTALSAVGEWSVSVKAENQLVVNSSTAGGALRLAGNEDWSGRYRANGAVPAFSPGAAFTFIGSIDGVNGVTGTAIVDSVKIDADIAGGKPWTHEVAFSANGPLSFGPAAAVDASVGIPPSSIGTQVQLSAPAASPSWAPLDQVTTISLEFRRENPRYVNSGTGGNVMRKCGPLDWTIAIGVHPDAEATASVLPMPTSVQGIEIILPNSGGSFTLNWAQFSDLSDLVVNRATQEIVSCVLHAAMCGVASVGGALTRGSITLPGSVRVWP